MMSAEQHVRSLLAAERYAEAIAFVRKSASEDDDWSSLCLAEWKLFGQGVARDLEGAVSLLEGAAERGFETASYRLSSLYLTGTGCPEQVEKAQTIVSSLRHLGDIVEAQVAFLEDHPEPEPDYACEVLAQEPHIRLFHNVLSSEECNWIKTWSAPMLQPSLVEEPGTGRRIPDPVRTSDGMSFGPLQEDLVINRINRRIARVSDTEYCCGEPLHVLRYAPGQQYRPHFDALPGVSNQRLLTAILYCNAQYEGGETAFPEIDLTIRAQQGDMLLFSNTVGSGRADPLSKHSGQPVISGEKWIATRWIRQTRHHPWM